MAYLTERQREAQYEEALRRINPNMTHPSMNATAAIAGQGLWPGQQVSAVNQAWPQAPLHPMTENVRNTRQFVVEKVDNGYVLRSGKYAKICKDMDELSQQFIATMVEQQLDK